MQTRRCCHRNTVAASPGRVSSLSRCLISRSSRARPQRQRPGGSRTVVGCLPWGRRCAQCRRVTKVRVCCRGPLAPLASPGTLSPRALTAPLSSCLPSICRHPLLSSSLVGAGCRAAGPLRTAPRAARCGGQGASIPEGGLPSCCTLPPFGQPVCCLGVERALYHSKSWTDLPERVGCCNFFWQAYPALATLINIEAVLCQAWQRRWPAEGGAET